MIIGLTGLRGVGKSLVSSHLMEAHGFHSVHAFAGGKAATKGYLQHLGVDSPDSEAMVNGHLKDVPCNLLPDNATPRYFMERLGKFMGTELGPEWTLGQEIRMAQEHLGKEKILIDSVVYEVDLIKNFGGKIIKIERDQAVMTGLETDKAVAGIIPDYTLPNNGNSVDTLHSDVDALIAKIAYEHSCEMQP